MTTAAQPIDREQAMQRTFAAAFAALDDYKSKNPEAASRIADFVAAHLRSGYPMAAFALGTKPQENPIHVANGVPFVEQPLSAKARYGIRRVDRGIELYLMDDTAHDACQVLSVSQSEQFAIDYSKVRASRG